MPKGIYKRKKMSEETKDKIRNALKGKKNPKVSKALKGKPKSPEHAKKCRENSLGYKWTEEQKDKKRKPRGPNKNPFSRET